jgi:hypothetical protein
MQTALTHTHSLLRYFVLILLVIVVINSLLGWVNKKEFTTTDNKLSLWLLIFTHIQLLVGLALYFMSDVVRFGPDTMKNSEFRYWTVEHSTMMIIAIVLITVARITHKKMPTDQAKHKRLFVLNVIALVIIIAAILASGRGFLIPTRYQ